VFLFIHIRYDMPFFKRQRVEATRDVFLGRWRSYLLPITNLGIPGNNSIGERNPRTERVGSNPIFFPRRTIKNLGSC